MKTNDEIAAGERTSPRNDGKKEMIKREIIEGLKANAAAKRKLHAALDLLETWGPV